MPVTPGMVIRIPPDSNDYSLTAIYSNQESHSLPIPSLDRSSPSCLSRQKTKTPSFWTTHCFLCQVHEIWISYPKNQGVELFLRDLLMQIIWMCVSKFLILLTSC